MSNANPAATAASGLAFFANLRVRVKILTGFAIVLLVLLAALAFGYSSFVLVARNIGHYASFNHEATKVSEIEAAFLRFRTHARDFVATGDEKYAQAVRSAAENLSPMLGNAGAEFVDQDHRSRLAEIEQAFNSFMKNFQAAQQVHGEYQQLVRQRLEPDGEKLVAGLDALIVHAEESGDFELHKRAVVALEHALRSRLYANILIGRRDEGVAGRVDNEFGALETSLKDITPHLNDTEDRQILSNVVDLSADYQATVAKIREGEIFMETRLRTEMMAASDTIIHDAEGLLEDIRTTEEHILDDMNARIRVAEAEILVASVAGIVLGIVIATFLGSRISSPIVAITAVMHRLAHDDLTVEVINTHRRDEIGEMARAVKVFKDNALRNQELEAAAIAQKQEAEEAQRRLMNQTADSFTVSVGQIVETVAAAAVELQSTADSMSELAALASNQTDAVASATEEASGNVQTVASATEQLNASIEEINRQVVLSRDIASQAVRESHDTHASMQELVQASESINNVIQIITEIASQTNMLALNATIEASRAGEAGKGFAVVASEVKTLSVQTARATEEIARQVGSVQSRTEAAASQLQIIAKTISDMDGIIAGISSAIEQQTAATREIAYNVEQAASGTRTVSTSITQVSDAVRETGSASGDVLTAALTLSQNFSTLKGATDEFVRAIRAA